MLRRWFRNYFQPEWDNLAPSPYNHVVCCSVLKNHRLSGLGGKQNPNKKTLKGSSSPLVSNLLRTAELVPMGVYPEAVTDTVGAPSGSPQTPFPQLRCTFVSNGSHCSWAGGARFVHTGGKPEDSGNRQHSGVALTSNSPVRKDGSLGPVWDVTYPPEPPRGIRLRPYRQIAPFLGFLSCQVWLL